MSLHLITVPFDDLSPKLRHRLLSLTRKDGAMKLMLAEPKLPDSYATLAVLRGHIIGWGYLARDIGDFLLSEYNGPTCGVFVHRHYRRQGVGSRITRQLNHLASENYPDYTELRAFPSDAGARMMFWSASVETGS